MTVSIILKKKKYLHIFNIRGQNDPFGNFRYNIFSVLLVLNKINIIPRSVYAYIRIEKSYLILLLHNVCLK